jgi:hypothetical protein
MANIIKIKRGLKENLPTLQIGEQAYCTDTNELFIGTDTGNVLVNGGGGTVEDIGTGEQYKIEVFSSSQDFYNKYIPSPAKYSNQYEFKENVDNLSNIVTNSSFDNITNTISITFTTDFNIGGFSYFDSWDFYSIPNGPQPEGGGSSGGGAEGGGSSGGGSSSGGGGGGGGSTSGPQPSPSNAVINCIASDFQCETVQYVTFSSTIESGTVISSNLGIVNYEVNNNVLTLSNVDSSYVVNGGSITDFVSFFVSLMLLKIAETKPENTVFIIDDGSKPINEEVPILDSVSSLGYNPNTGEFGTQLNNVTTVHNIQANVSENAFISGGSYNSQINGSRNSTIIDAGTSIVNGGFSNYIGGSGSVINGGIYSTIHSENSVINGGNSNTAGVFGTYRISNQINASEQSTVKTNLSMISSAIGSRTESRTAQIHSSLFSAAGNSANSGANDGSVVISSRAVSNLDDFSIAGGFATTSTASTANRKWHILSRTGNINIAGTLTSNASFSDFAELFPNATGQAQGYGLLQTLNGYGVKPAQENDKIIGVVSGTAGILLNDTTFHWQGRYIIDEWGMPVYEYIKDDNYILEEDLIKEYQEKFPDVIVVDEIPEQKERQKKYELKENIVKILHKHETIVQKESEIPLIKVQKENPNYDIEREQISRKERPDEWTVVGLTGQVYVRLNKDVKVGDNVKAWKDGIGQTSEKDTNIIVMKITQEYDNSKGYAIGFCLIK